MRLIPILVALLLTIAPAGAETLLEGRAEQGGLMLGRATAGARVELDGRAVPVDDAGRFLIGFGRNAGPVARLDILGPDGESERRVIAVAARAWPVQRIEGLAREMVEPDPAGVARIKAEAERLAALRQKSSPVAGFLGGLTWPAEGLVSGVFGSQRVYNGQAGAPHSGLDIAAPAGTPVRAAAGGTVVLADPDLFLTGRTVMIDHGLGLMSSYAHLSAIAVSAGETVVAGQIIGAIGASGLATGAHLHWGLSWQDVRLDPKVGFGVLGTMLPDRPVQK